MELAEIQLCDKQCYSLKSWHYMTHITHRISLSCVHRKAAKQSQPCIYISTTKWHIAEKACLNMFFLNNFSSCMRVVWNILFKVTTNLNCIIFVPFYRYTDLLKQFTRNFLRWRWIVIFYHKCSNLERFQLCLFCILFRP